MERREFIQKASLATAAAAGGAALAGLAGCAQEPSNTAPDAVPSRLGGEGGKSPRVQSLWQPPLLLDFTILPAKVTSVAWTNPTFKAALLADPTAKLREYTAVWPRDRNFAIVEDSCAYRYLSLPYRKLLTSGWTKQQLIDELIAETGFNDMTLECILPPSAIAEAWVSPTFRAGLLANPNGALQSLGIPVGSYELRIVESTATLTYLVLMSNPLQQQQLSVQMLLSRLTAVYGDETTKCCQSGTCDDDFPH